MQIKIAFRAIFYSGGCKVYGVETGEFSRWESQSVPQNATSVSGTPQSRTDAVSQWQQLAKQYPIPIDIIDHIQSTHQYL